MGQFDDLMPSPSNLSFESLKKLNKNGVEYWSARDLQQCFGYSQWRRFENAIEKAIESCGLSGNNPSHHFAAIGKPIVVYSLNPRMKLEL